MIELQITQVNKQELIEIVKTAIDKSLSEYQLNIELGEPPILLNIKQASEFLTLKVPTIYQKVSRREIPFLKRSKRLYFKREDLIEYLEKGRVKSVYEVEAESEAFPIKRGGTK